MDWNSIEWLDLVLRWFHVMAGISWIGSSLYFMWLDRVLADHERVARGEHGEPWLIDLVGSLLAAKLKPGTDGLARTHVWFWRETTFTWVSGILLLAAVAWLPGRAILTDAGGQAIGVLVGGSVIAGLLVLSWLCYDLLWRSAGDRWPAVSGAISCAAFVVAAWGLTQIFSGRVAFILAGAALGNIMLANVWLRILPALRNMNEARVAGRFADVNICSRARMRAAHNSYLICPTVLLMLSNHYPRIYSHQLNWIALSLLAVAFMGVRHRVVNGRVGAWALYSAVAALSVAIYLVATGPSSQTPTSVGDVPFATVRAIIANRCVSCHSTVPSNPTFSPNPGGVGFDRPESIKRHAGRIKVSAVIARTMPPDPQEHGITAAERELLGRWVDQGARLK
jgi:uncharacterized membrane protein